MLKSNKKLYYISAHKHAFEIDNLYPLNLFEGFVERIEKIEKTENCVLESSCKIDHDKLYPVRFNIGFPNNSIKQLHAVMDFFRRVESRVDVKLNLSLFQQFIGNDFKLDKMTDLMLGIDLRRDLSDSRLKIGLTIEDYPEKQKAAVILNNNIDEVTSNLLISNRLHIGFDFYLNGRSEMELYPHIMQQDFQKLDVQQRLSKVLSPPALQVVPACTRICVGISKANRDKIIYYYLENMGDFLNYFTVNDTARKVHAYYLKQPVVEMCVALPESELLAGTTIKNLNLYYLL
uniref:Prenyltransferase n=1 Tax=Microcystis aeruginosa TaxID=1126 RepID=A0A7R7VF66_MICAE|nr:prenyltransferase [Microcystis aeruginosa]